ncbi:MarR family winged helix-turn-helix transcriptional regulator [Flavivirga spongiicola]|uniref:MarR family winged helix-turn-helix transcriptional regulator n=1 Tax=Flavivirga spongiicola TaxID=421621 RepID=A0ABU7XN45_9FLAO|nr:MarR family winged helix-turn-helix transcriptional regulator [Flavivirga sp. MEBiC05379]MDO5981532.1 MarR family winged helix-turn-helix transcriptional regulator [Flavivirga sp. MEBiC05379]
MEKSVFNIEFQQKSITSKIVVGLERISEVFKSLLWEHAKVIGLSPIQIQILIFIAYHKSELCNVSHLAKEFNITKPTVSDAIRMLDKKKYITKDYSLSDSRSYSILLSDLGKKMVSETENFANPIEKQLKNIETADLENVFETLSKLIHQLNNNRILTVQRTCFSCNFYDKSENRNYCNLMEKELLTPDIRLDCPEYEEKSAGNNV